MKKRKLVFFEKLFPHTFVFFFQKGDDQTSYSFRDYTQGGLPIYGKTLPYTADQVLGMCKWVEEAETVRTDDEPYWRARIEALNQKYRIEKRKPDVGEKDFPPQKIAGVALDVHQTQDLPVSQFPILNQARLLAHPVKGSKPQDLERIFCSPNSEDYVTWNTVQLLNQYSAAQWWPSLLLMAQADNQEFSLQFDPTDLPVLETWKRYPAPKTYEQLSRERMAQSNQPEWVERSKNPRPVEGPSEIDLVSRGRDYLVFIEAKLGSDISLTTTYDPSRNQIVRNIDVLLDVCGDRTPVFWILAKDKGQAWSYTHQLRIYQENPENYRRLFHTMIVRV